MAIETVAAVMACAKLGAVWVPIFSGFGPDAVAARLADARCTVLDHREREPAERRRRPDEADRGPALAQTDVVRHVLVWMRLPDEPTAMTAGRDVAWSEAVDPAATATETPPLPSEHPLFIGYTSGTTGTPKGVVHVHGGFLVKIAEEVAYQVDLHPGERLHWSTDLGWIMGPWEIVGALALGATVVLTEGSPIHPDAGRLWAQVERHRITTLGVSPTLIRALIGAGTGPVQAHDRSSLRILASTGEPWNPDAYLWLHREVGEERLPIINFSGGTEVGACFLSPHPVVPMKVVSVGGPALGMDVDIVDERGDPVGAGAVGELVCRQPWPAMTRGVHGDPERYLDAYWRRFPGLWVHGDWASRDADGYWFLHGRSDDTLNVAGKRIGPAEVESALGSHPAVRESAAVGIPDPVKGEVDLVRGGAPPGRPGHRHRAPRPRPRAPRGLVHPRARRARPRAAEDPEREDRPPRGARGAPRRRPGRPLLDRGPGNRGRDPRRRAGDVRVLSVKRRRSGSRRPSPSSAGAAASRRSGRRGPRPAGRRTRARTAMGVPRSTARARR